VEIAKGAFPSGEPLGFLGGDPTAKQSTKNSGPTQCGGLLDLLPWSSAPQGACSGEFLILGAQSFQPRWGKVAPCSPDKPIHPCCRGTVSHRRYGLDCEAGAGVEERDFAIHSGQKLVDSATLRANRCPKKARRAGNIGLKPVWKVSRKWVGFYFFISAACGVGQVIQEIGRLPCPTGGRGIVRAIAGVGIGAEGARSAHELCSRGLIGARRQDHGPPPLLHGPHRRPLGGDRFTSRHFDRAGLGLRHRKGPATGQFALYDSPDDVPTMNIHGLPIWQALADRPAGVIRTEQSKELRGLAKAIFYRKNRIGSIRGSDVYSGTLPAKTCPAGNPGGQKKKGGGLSKWLFQPIRKQFMILGRTTRGLSTFGAQKFTKELLQS